MLMEGFNVMENSALYVKPCNGSKSREVSGSCSYSGSQGGSMGMGAGKPQVSMSGLPVVSGPEARWPL